MIVGALLVATIAAAAGGTTSTAGDAPLPPRGLGALVALGKAVFEETGTHPLSRPFVRNALTCESCHPEAGARSRGSTLRGVAAAYPAWSPRERAVITLEDRIANCFMRSMDGVRPPPGGAVSVALATYLTWLSTGAPIAMNADAPAGPRALPKPFVDEQEVDAAAGAALYAARCAGCHGRDGDADPPLWGPRSYNAGAGFADVAKLAAWVRVTMPPGDETLTEREAVNVAAFVDSRPRPDFVLRDHLPRGPQPAPYNSRVLDEVVRAPTWPPRW